MKLPSSLKVSTCGPSRCRLERIYMQTSLLKRAVSSTTLSKIWLSVGPIFYGFAYNSLVSRPFLTRKVPNRSSQCPLSNGQRVASQIQLWVWLTPRSNLSQTWSTLVKLGQTTPNSGKCALDYVLKVFGYSGPQLGQLSWV